MDTLAFDDPERQLTEKTANKTRRAAMPAEEFCAWLKHVNFSERHAARTLQISRTTVAKYRQEGAPAHIGFACAAIALGMPIWQRGTE
ncbi:hypothetical protein H7H48_19700 [Nitratireductor sp. B36]|uniref:hypothetical protein n=1 Tax=Nitratireductor sp. B36 TaxID=2762059 RepID=UPI001E463F30|nr:hypothetical protein [Nitratireductor sp. B36]MCC5781295.1 hypothetical protein [Nitratireductor sp. B36]